MKKKYLPIYKKWMKQGRMDYRGLCYVNKVYQDLIVFVPDYIDQQRLMLMFHSTAYWGSDSKNERRYVFTKLRQNIVLFMAAINDEL